MSFTASCRRWPLNKKMDFLLEFLLKFGTSTTTNAKKTTASEVLAKREKVIGQACTVFFSSDPVYVDRARGIHVYDENGDQYLDCISNVQNVGHCHPKVVAAAHAQMSRTNCNNRFLHDNLVECAAKIAETLPGDLNRSFFCNSGSEANDLALRISRDFTHGTDVIVMDHAYHGHLTSMIEISPYKFNGVGGKGKPDWVHVLPVPDVYRGKHRLSDEKLNDPEALAEIGRTYADEILALIDGVKAAGRNLCAFYMEALQSCGGQVIPPPGYLKRITEHVHSAGGLVIVDEVQTGFGRAGSSFWAFQTQGDVIPDIVTMGKPMGNGFPVSAVVTRDGIAAQFGGGMQYFNTFGGNPVSCAVVLATMKVLEEEGLQRNALNTGNYTLQLLRSLQKKYPCIGDVRGVGLFIGIELVKDRKSRAPDGELAKRVINRLRRPHRILLSAEGPDANIIKFKPPLCFSMENADEMCEKLNIVLGEIAAKNA